MNWRDEWNAIAARIGGLAASADLLTQSLRVAGQSNDPIFPYLQLQCQAILESVTDFSVSHGDTVSPTVWDAFNKFKVVIAWGPDILQHTAQSIIQNVVFPLTLLSAEVDYLLSDFSAITRRRTERAFLHLQRSILIDGSYRTKWIEAFQTHETHCEKAGCTALA